MDDLARANAIRNIDTPEKIEDQLNDAWDTLNKVQPYINYINNTLEGIENNKSLGKKALFAFCGWVVVIAIVFMPLGLLTNIGLLQNSKFDTFAEYFAVPSLFIGIILSIIFQKKQTDKRYEEIDKAREKLWNIYNNSNTCIPMENLYDDALEYIHKMVMTGRAQTLSQALALLEEQEHRWTVQGQNNEILRKQEVILRNMSSSQYNRYY